MERKIPGATRRSPSFNVRKEDASAFLIDTGVVLGGSDNPLSAQFHLFSFISLASSL